jgi:hypothetical protein
VSGCLGESECLCLTSLHLVGGPGGSGSDTGRSDGSGFGVGRCLVGLVTLSLISGWIEFPIRDKEQ